MAISEARKRANAKYNAKAYDRVELKVNKGKKDTIKAHAEKHGKSLNGFINEAIDEKMRRDASAAQPLTGDEMDMMEELTLDD